MVSDFKPDVVLNELTDLPVIRRRSVNWQI